MLDDNVAFPALLDRRIGYQFSPTFVTELVVPGVGGRAVRADLKVIGSLAGRRRREFLATSTTKLVVLGVRRRAFAADYLLWQGCDWSRRRIG